MTSTPPPTASVRRPGLDPDEGSWPLATPQLRVGDEERTTCAGQLADAFADGRLSAAEHEARLSSALAALTAGELAALLRDLPAPDRGEPVRGGRAAADPLLVTLLRVSAFQFVLILLAFCVGVDLESENRSAVAISVEVWVVGTLGGTAGYLIGRGGRTSRAAGAGRA